MKIEERIQQLETYGRQHMLTADLLKIIAQRFPDAEEMQAHSNVLKTKAASAHAHVTHIDTDALAFAVNFDPTAPFLYLMVGELRVYSSRPVAIAESFKIYCDGGCHGNLIDIMRSTTPEAEKCLAKERADSLLGLTDEERKLLANGASEKDIIARRARSK